MNLVGAKLKNFYDFTNKNEGENRLKPQSVQVKIPHYQRPYEWSSENVSLLVNDTLNNSDGQYFSGASVSSIHNEYCHELVDGQQRYTTLFLINYCVFLISRVALREALTIGAYVHANTLAETLKKSMEYIFTLKQDGNGSKLEISDITKEINRLINLDDDDPECDMRRISELKAQRTNLKKSSEGVTELYYSSVFEKKYSELLTIIKEKGNAAIKDDSDPGLESFYALAVITDLKQQDELYVQKNMDLQRYFFDNAKFRITYARNKYVELIKESLVSIDFTLSSQVSLSIMDNNPKFLSNYKTAIQTIFEEVSNRIKEKNPLENAVQTLKMLTTILESLDICVVQTGNQSDATVLFDVLNDRSKELSQLSLIKNEFYKRVVIHNDQTDVLTDDELDKYIDKVDELWVDEIFNASAADAALVSYLGSCFLSGSTTTNYSSNGKETRTTISEYLRCQTKYAVEDLVFDVSLFHAIKVILTKVGVKYQKQNDVSLTAEAEHKSIFERTIKLLIAKKQEGILSGLINFTLFHVLTKQAKKACFDMNVLKNEIDLILSSENEVVNKQCLEIWISSLSSKDFLLPRKLSKQLISFYYKDKALSTNESCSLNTFMRDPSSRVELEAWLSEWKYKSSNQFDVKVLLINLMSCDPRKNIKLRGRSPQFISSFKDASSCHLDHFEPKSLPSINMNAYFQSENRDDLVNSLGNMMLLTQVDNQRKSDSPAIEADKYYSNSDISGSWLYKALHENFIKYSNEGVPTEAFFTERKKELISQIVEMLHS
ncbi:DUF262 domain-containing protein [Aliivibrio fischeri]|uniref:GmrSD restriction endonuclease domain-containing protein n=1 Tax=Aliivibrio fischeri TaxID=668 RepID=UPI002E32366C|nr:DUF262 domain-containing protein [Aliivibrio fischeri]MCE7535945.1 DUF262 domain-containing HNH endonuclease family protein [Aliivibrio fischeri]MCE7558607.1 DUF262 domain-containing HNH endonuclease family protein [Aliivibrio fischeri]